MLNNVREDLGYLGYEFQMKLVSEIIKDKKFGDSIIEYLFPNHFDNDQLKLIFSKLKNYYETYSTIPTLNVLEIILNTEIKNDTLRLCAIDVLEEIKLADSSDFKYIQKKCERFLKQQNAKRVWIESKEVIENGDDTDIDKLEEAWKKVFKIGSKVDEGEIFFTDIEDVLNEDFRKPITTSIAGLDKIMNGGLGRGELALIIAPLGVGKTTMSVKLGYGAFTAGYNVLYIFFEDTKKQVKRRILSAATTIEMNSLHLHKEEVFKKVDEWKCFSNSLMLKKYSSEEATTSSIRKFIDKKTQEGFRPDVVIIDYVDCITPNDKYEDALIGEGKIMREIESMCQELDFAAWVMTQGNRNSIGKDIVTTDMMGGSIKKAQIGHFIMTIAKTQEQKEKHKATIAITKSRFGKDGYVLNDVTFNNANMDIVFEDIHRHDSFADYGKKMEQEKNDRIKAVLGGNFEIDPI